MKKNLLILLLLILLVFYLVFWPVPINPQAWEAPVNKGYTGLFATNNRMSSINIIDLKGEQQPEFIKMSADGKLFAAVASGKILRMNPDGSEQEVFANTGGRPLGFDFDAGGNIVVADAHKGLLLITPTRQVTVLTNQVDGDPIRFANSAVVAQNGKIYFTDSTRRFVASDGVVGSERNDVSVLDVIENSATGRVLEYDPISKQTRTLVNGLSFANGLVLSKDQKYLWVAEMARYRIWKIAVDSNNLVANQKNAQTQVVLENLPGFPDNLTWGLNDKIWVGFTVPRNEILDRLSMYPLIRKLIVRLPSFLTPKPEKYGHAMAFTEDGKVVENYQDPTGKYPRVTGVTETNDRLYFHNVNDVGLGWIPKSPVK